MASQSVKVRLLNQFSVRYNKDHYYSKNRTLAMVR